MFSFTEGIFRSLTHRQVSEPNPQVPQLLSRTPVASTGTHRSSSQYHGSVSGSLGASGFSNQPTPPRSPAFPGAYTSNPSAGHIPLSTPASSTTQPRQGVPVMYGAGGNTGSSSYSGFPADTRPSTTTRTTASGGEPLPPSCSLVIINRVPNSYASKGHNPPQYHGSGTVTGPTSSSINAHQSRQCKLPGCRKSAIFDRTINEQREFCEDHIGYVLNSLVRTHGLIVTFDSRHVVPVGFAGCCVMCKKMPARLDSEFCSDACRSMNLNVQMGSSINNVTRQQQPTATRPPQMQMQRSVSSGASAPVGVSSKRQVENTAPEGLIPACQECRRPIMKETRTGNRFCSKACEEANRKYNSSSSSSSKSRR